MNFIYDLKTTSDYLLDRRIAQLSQLQLFSNGVHEKKNHKKIENKKNVTMLKKSMHKLVDKIVRID